MMFRIGDFDHQVVDPSLEDSRPLRGRKITGHGCIGNKELSVVRSASVTAVLLLLFEYTDHTVGRTIHHQNLPDGGLAGEQLVARLHPENNYAPALLIVIVSHQPAFLHLKRAEALVFRPHTAHGTRRCVVATYFGYASPQLRADRSVAEESRYNAAS